MKLDVGNQLIAARRGKFGHRPASDGREQRIVDRRKVVVETLNADENHLPLATVALDDRRTSAGGCQYAPLLSCRNRGEIAHSDRAWNSDGCRNLKLQRLRGAGLDGGRLQGVENSPPFQFSSVLILRQRLQRGDEDTAVIHISAKQRLGSGIDVADAGGDQDRKTLRREALRLLFQ